MVWRYVGVFVGVFACSVSVIFIKESHTHPFVLSALRLLIASVLLSPLAWRDFRANRAVFGRAQLRRTTLPAAVMAVHFMSWTIGARMTISAQASLVVNLVPIAIPFFLHGLTGEMINRREIVGTVLAIAGIAVLSAHDAFNGGGDALGNGVCFASMLLFAWYLALGRKNRDFPTIWLYVVPVYAQAGLICLLAGSPWIGGFQIGSWHEWSMMLGLAVVPTIIGHSLLNGAMRHLRGQIVSLCNVSQFVFAGVMGFFIFHELPSATFYAASALAVAGVAVVVLAAPPQPRLR